MKIQVVKFGSNCLFENGKLNIKRLRKNWALQFKRHEDETGEKTYIRASGAVAMAKYVRGDKRKTSDISTRELISLAGVGQHKLMDVYDDVFKGVYTVSQVLITDKEEVDIKEGRNFIRSVRYDLRSGIISISNYNDRLSFSEVRKDNDIPAANDSILLNAVRFIMVGTYDGLLDNENDLVKDVYGVKRKHFDYCKGRSSSGTGGMRTHLIAAKISNTNGIDALLCNVNYGFLDHLERRVDNTFFHASSQKPYK